ncbi:MAG: hypothetical protein CMN77_13195 [Spirochaetaceae bacterium]|nr:hypothetical protein [Spirochaetaceae bacterium]|tara:strand:+ start:1625 stop:2173 length:549 start_codon:yes stop_codon:yes gene_type:complete
MRIYSLVFCIPLLSLLIFCKPRIDKAREFSSTTQETGQSYFLKLAEICGDGYLVNHRDSSVIWNGKGWNIDSNMYVSLGAEARSVEEARRNSRQEISHYLECMFVVGLEQKPERIKVTLTFADIEDIFNPLVLGIYELKRETLNDLENWDQEPSFLDRHRVSQFIESHMETRYEDWSEIVLE